MSEFNKYNINNYSILSYAHILNDIKNFKRSGTNGGSEFNYYDTTGHKYFKIFFYFGQDNLSDNGGGFSTGGLLTPTWLEYNSIEKSIETNGETRNITAYDEDYSTRNMPFYNYNSAWAYLMLNDEKQRAEHLEQFVNLLSNINSESPWYFKAIEGISDALDRKPATDNKFEFNENKKITIKCLPDAFDNRITTLLDLYRDVIWSWNMKKEIIPSNLRKFDMAVYIFESPILNWHNDEDTVGSDNGYTPSYKMLEFHNCEFDYNSIKSGWSTLDNTGGFNPEYSIEINYDDCYEISYNEFMMRKIGDVILTDLIDTTSKNISDSVISKVWPYTAYDKDDNNKKIDGLKKRANLYDKGFLGNAVNQLVSTGVNYLEDKLERAILGNLHTYSLTNIASQLKTAMQGGVIQTVQAANDYIDAAKKRKENAHKTVPTGNILQYKESTTIKPSGNITESVEFNKAQPSGTITAQQVAALKIMQKPTGNIFSNVTLVNNI